jgi:hypothetical protein
MSDSGNAFSDILKDLRGAWSSRISNPLIGAFALSWLAVNYRAVIVFISSASYETKFAFIDAHLYPDPNAVALKCFFLPLALALLYIYVLPKPTERVFTRALEHQRELNKIARQVAEERLLSSVEAKAILVEAEVKVADGKKRAEDDVTRARAEAEGAIARAEEVRASAESDLRKVQKMASDHADMLSEKDRQHTSLVNQLMRDHESALTEFRSKSGNLMGSIAELRWALTYERALSAATADKRELKPRLEAVLTTKRVTVLVNGNELASVKFEIGGLFGDKDGLDVGGWLKWQISDSGRLLIFDDGDRQIASFNWHKEDGIWVGNVNMVQTHLLIQKPEVRPIQ